MKKLLSKAAVLSVAVLTLASCSSTVNPINNEETKQLNDSDFCTKKASLKNNNFSAGLVQINNLTYGLSSSEKTVNYISDKEPKEKLSESDKTSNNYIEASDLNEGNIWIDISGSTPVKKEYSNGLWKVLEEDVNVAINPNNTVELVATEFSYDDAKSSSLYKVVNKNLIKNYVFDGWYVNGIKVSSSLKYEFVAPTGNVTCEAKWVENPVTLEVNNDYAGKVSFDGDLVLGETAKVKAINNSGYAFEGWYNNNVKVSEDEKLEMEVLVDASTYKAKWIPVRSGSIFEGWYKITKDSEGKTVSTKVSSDIEYEVVSVRNDNGEITDTYEARFVENPIKFTAKNGSVKVDTKSTVENGVTLIAKADSGKLFEAWYKVKEDAEGNKVKEKVSTNVTYLVPMPEKDDDGKYIEQNYEAVFIDNPIVYATNFGTIEEDILSTETDGVTLTATADAGYKFDGWYFVEYGLSTVTADTFAEKIEDLFTRSGSGTEESPYVYTNVQANSSFDNSIQYYEIVKTKVSDALTTTIGMPTKNAEGKYTIQNYEANFIKDSYKVEFASNTEGVVIKNKSGETETNATDGDYEFGSEIKLGVSVPEGSSAIWYLNNKAVAVGSTYSYTVLAEDSQIKCEIKNYQINSLSPSTVKVGRYPQTKVTDQSLITSLTTKSGNLPSQGNLGSWKDYGYYVNGNKESYMYYIDIDNDQNGTYDYRGVYFTSYRRYYLAQDGMSYFDTVNNREANSSFQKDNGYETNNVYWFKYEDVSWKVVDKTGDKCLLVSDLVLDSQNYSVNYNTTKTGNDVTLYSNNYEISYIRAWLNENMYNTLFNEKEKNSISTTKVSNVVSTSSIKTNYYSSNDVNDKLFLLSVSEFDKLGNSDKTGKGTDYAKSQGLFVLDSTTNLTTFWLRSAVDKDIAVNKVTDNGTVGLNQVDFNNIGVRVACYIDLSLSD